MSPEIGTLGQLSSIPPGKCQSRPLVASIGGTMSIQERLSGRNFLIDSGADEYVFPATASDRTLPQSLALRAANGSSIASFGKKKICLSFAPGHRIKHEFWIAEVSRPILGCDFFLAQNLVIDVPR